MLLEHSGEGCKGPLSVKCGIGWTVLLDAIGFRPILSAEYFWCENVAPLKYIQLVQDTFCLFPKKLGNP